MIKGIIFDMDGVMIDTENQSNLGWLWAADRENIEMPLWLIDSFKGAPANLHTPVLLPSTKINPPGNHLFR